MYISQLVLRAHAQPNLLELINCQKTYLSCTDSGGLSTELRQFLALPYTSGPCQSQKETPKMSLPQINYICRCQKLLQLQYRLSLKFPFPSCSLPEQLLSFRIDVQYTVHCTLYSVQYSSQSSSHLKLKNALILAQPYFILEKKNNICQFKHW